MLKFVSAALAELDFGGDWCALRMEWFQIYAKGRVSSTRHGYDFFQVTYNALLSGSYTYLDNEYDRNYALILKDEGVTIRPA